MVWVLRVEVKSGRLEFIKNVNVFQMFYKRHCEPRGGLPGRFVRGEATLRVASYNSVGEKRSREGINPDDGLPKEVIACMIR